MTTTPARTAQALFALTVLMYLVTVVLGVANLAGHAPSVEGDFVFTCVFGAGLLPIGYVGTMVAVRRPEHPVGWVLVIGVAVMTLAGLGGEYGAYALYIV